MTKRVLVTGSQGFVGQSVRRALSERGYETVGVGTKESGAELELDLADPAFDARELATRVGKVDGIIYLAAKISRTSSVDAEARRNLKAIAETPVEMLEAFHERFGPSHFVFCSSIKVYGASPAPIDPLTGPFRPEPFCYGAAKLFGERLLEAAARRLHTGFATVRPSYIYGPDQRATNAIPIFLSACFRGERPLIFGDGSELRDDVLVSDVAYCLVEALVRRAQGAFNATGEAARTLREVAEACCRAAAAAGAPRGLEPRFDPSRKPKPWVDQRFDHSRSGALLGYRPTPLSLGLEAEARAFAATLARTSEKGS